MRRTLLTTLSSPTGAAAFTTDTAYVGDKDNVAFQSSGTAGTATIKVSIDGINFVTYVRAIDETTGAVSATLPIGVYLVTPDGADHIVQIRFDVVGATADYKITLHAY